MNKEKLEQLNTIHQAAIDKKSIRPLNEIIGSYKHTNETESDGTTRITIQDSIRNRSIKLVAYKEIILSLSFGPYNVDAIVDNMVPMADAGPDVDQVDIADYDTLKQVLAAFLKGAYKLTANRKIMQIVTRDFTYDYDLPKFDAADEASLTPVEPFADAAGNLPQPSRLQRWNDALTSFEIDDNTTYVLVVLVVFVLVAIGYLIS